MIVRVACAGLPAASRAVTVITLTPDCKVIPVTVQFAVPAAVPPPQRSHAQVTCVTPTLSEALPPILRLLKEVE